MSNFSLTQKTWEEEAKEVSAERPSNILFLCVHNSARSQLAQAIARKLAQPGVNTYSAGSIPSSVRPEVEQVLQEMQISAEGLSSKPISAIDISKIDLVITLCQEEVCPVFPRPVRHLHWALPDPSAVPAGSEEDQHKRLEAFRQTATELQKRLKMLIG